MKSTTGMMRKICAIFRKKSLQFGAQEFCDRPESPKKERCEIRQEKAAARAIQALCQGGRYSLREGGS
jgi:hypothetical protein